MQDRQISGIDLPVKTLAWEDGEGIVWLSCNDAHWIAERHGLGEPSKNAVAAIAAGMQKVVAGAAGTDLP